MNDALLPAGDGHTELSEDDRVGLIPSYIATRGDLFAAEQRNIAVALLRRAPSVPDLLDDGYLRGLHRDLFGQVWEWAGRYRRFETNIGIDPKQISVAVRMLVHDIFAWVDNETYEPDELAVRFHHRLVAIRTSPVMGWLRLNPWDPFPNGNGRHGRVAAEYLAMALGRQRFGWGIGLDVDTEELRAIYRRALQRADALPGWIAVGLAIGDIDELLTFARS